MFAAVQGTNPLAHLPTRASSRTSSLLALAAAMMPLVACGGGPTSPDPVDFQPEPAETTQASTLPAPADLEAACDIKRFEVMAVNFVGQSVFPAVVRVRIANAQPACLPLRLTVWDATDPDNQKFMVDSDGRFPPDSELSVEIPCGIHVQVDLNNSPYTPAGAHYSPGYFVKGWRGNGPACSAPAAPEAAPTPAPTPGPTPTPAPTPVPPTPVPTPKPPVPVCDVTNPPYSHYEASGSATPVNGGRGVHVTAAATLVNGRYRVKLMASDGNRVWVKDVTEAHVECSERRRVVRLCYRNETAHADSRFWVRIEPQAAGRPAREIALN